MKPSQPPVYRTLNFSMLSASFSSFATPLKWLIQLNTSRCQTKEFSGFNTHYNHRHQHRLCL